MQRIFDAFSQEDSSTTRKYGGTGLGLTISNKLLALMDSRLQVTSEVGKGSVFFFDISFKTLEGEAVTSDNLEGIKKILIVDDNANNRLILKDMLAMKDILTEEAESGIIALEKIRSGKKYDVVLMDFHMPEMDGIETIRNIRQNIDIHATEQPIILLYSSSDDESINIACKELDVQQRLVKPIKIKQLFDSLSRVNSKSAVEEAVVLKEETDKDWLKKIPTKIKVLIAEDNVVNMFLATTIIGGLLPDVQLIEATNGKEALELFKSEKPDIVFIDVQMPDMNGYEATAAIRNIETNSRTPIIALTAGIVKGEKEKCLQAGMDDYISKPVVKDAIENALRYWLVYNKDYNDHLQKENQVEDNLVHFDVEKLKARLSNKEAFFVQFLALIRKNIDQPTTDMLNDMKESLASENLVNLRTVAHKMKGTALSACFDQLADLLKEVEKYTDFNKEKLTILLDKIIAEIQYLRQYLAQMNN